MSVIDIRSEGEDMPTKIIFGKDEEYLEEMGGVYYHICCPVNDEQTELYKSDIDNLIKALEKAKQLWT